MSEKSPELQVVLGMFENMRQEDWEKVKQALADDVLYRVGSKEPLHGSQAVVDFLSSLYKEVKFQGADIREIWDMEGVKIVEMDANYVRLKDNKPVQFACTDILRMNGKHIREWRVYPDMLPMYAD
jgi:ketosteroid isomerase-like protein